MSELPAGRIRPGGPISTPAAPSRKTSSTTTPNASRVGSLEGNAQFRYVRLREPPYSDGDLEALAEQLRPLLDEGMRVYCYFKHEDEPTAPSYARRLLELLG